MKKLISLLMAACLCISLMPQTIAAAETKDYVYYDLESIPQAEWKDANPCTVGNVTLKGWCVARLYREYNVTVKGDENGKPILSMDTSSLLKAHIVNGFLNQNADYTPDLRMAQLRFHFTAQGPDTVKQIWQSLEIASKAALTSRGSGTISSPNFGLNLPSDIGDSEQILYFFRNYYGSANYAVPICTIEPNTWHTLTFLYDQSTWQAKRLFLDDAEITTLLDGSPLADTPLLYQNGYRFLNMDFDGTTTRSNLLAVGKSDAAKDTLSFSRIRYTGYTNELDGAGTDLDDEAAKVSVPANSTISVRFSAPMMAESISPETVRITDGSATVSYTSYSYDADSRTYTIDLADSPLLGNHAYTLEVGTEVKTLFGDSPTQPLSRSFFTAAADAAKIVGVEQSGDAALVSVQNISSAARSVTVYGSHYTEKNGGRLASSLGSQTKSLAPNETAVFRFENCNTEEGFAKFFVWDGMEALGAAVRFDGESLTEGDETPTESIPLSGSGITLDTPTVDVNTGLVQINGYYHDLPQRRATVLLKNPADDTILYTEQCKTDANGAFSLGMVIPQGTVKGDYPLYIQAGAMTEPTRHLLTLDFTAAVPAVTDLKLDGTAFAGEEIRALYSYTHMANVAEGASDFVWESAETKDGTFSPIEGANGKTVTLDESYAYKYIRYTVTPQTVEGIIGDSRTSPAFRVYVRPEINNLSVSVKNDALIINYDYSHPRGYGEKNHVFKWLCAANENGVYSVIGGAEGARYQPTAEQKGCWFKVEMTPCADVPADETEAAYGKSVVTPAVYFIGSSYTGGGSKDTGGSNRGGGAVIAPKREKTNTAPTDGSKPQIQFNDVSAAHWAASAIQNLCAEGILSGVTATSFEPERSVTRAEFVKMLVMVLGLQETAYNGAFRDVSAEDWYAGILQSAYESGLVTGADGLFWPNRPISREEMAKLLVCACEQRLGAITAEEAAFTDRAAFSAWAAAYIDKAAAAGLVSGMEDGTFNAQGSASRAQAAVVAERLLTGIRKGGLDL